MEQDRCGTSDPRAAIMIDRPQETYLLDGTSVVLTSSQRNQMEIACRETSIGQDYMAALANCESLRAAVLGGDASLRVDYETALLRLWEVQVKAGRAAKEWVAANVKTLGQG